MYVSDIVVQWCLDRCGQFVCWYMYVGVEEKTYSVRLRVCKKSIFYTTYVQ